MSSVVQGVLIAGALLAGYGLFTFLWPRLTYNTIAAMRDPRIKEAREHLKKGEADAAERLLLSMKEDWPSSGRRTSPSREA